MERRRLGRAGFDVPAVGVGTWRTFDTDADCRPLVEAGLGAGADLFDSSPMYGLAEQALATAVAGRREEVLVATKIWTHDESDGREQAANALRIFGTVDVYQVHNLVNAPAQLRLLAGLRDQGRVRALGATHYQESAFAEMAALMRSGRIDMIQIPYNPLRRTAERELLPLAEALDIGVMVMSPLQGGILDRRPSAAQLRELGAETWPQAVIKWILADRRVSCVLTTSHRAERIASNAAAGSQPALSPDQRALVERIAAG